MFSCIALLGMLAYSCKPEATDDGKDKDNQEQNNNGDNGNGEEQQPVDKSLIKIDGDFADWEALPEGYVKTFASNPESKRQTIAEASFFADESCLYIKFTLNSNPDSLDAAHHDYAIHVYLDADNDPFTGGYAGQPYEFADSCDFAKDHAMGAEIQLEQTIWKGTKVPDPFLPTLHQWDQQYPFDSDSDDTDIQKKHGGWRAWTEIPALFTIGESAWDKDSRTMEIQVYFSSLALADDLPAETIRAGFSIERDWKPVGAIPNGPVTETDIYGRAQLAVVPRYLPEE